MSLGAIPLLDAPALVRFGPPEPVKGEQPAAGAMFSQEIGGSFYERLIVVGFRLVTSAVVADRGVGIEYRDDEDLRWTLAGAPVVQTASDTIEYMFQAWLGQPDWEVVDSVLAPLPPVLLYPSWNWRILVSNIDAGDQLSRVRFIRERFYTGQNPTPGP